MTKHILVAGKLHPSALRVLDSAEGVSFDYVPDADPTAYLPLLPKAQGLVLRTQTLTLRISPIGKGAINRLNRGPMCCLLFRP